MIDLSNETILALSNAAKNLPPGRKNRPVSFQCVLRWVLNGARAPDGQLVKLEALRLGGRWVTSKEALQRFAEALTPTFAGSPASPTDTPRQRRKAAEKVERELEELGI
jgi:hypothetical protein